MSWAGAGGGGGSIVRFRVLWDSRSVDRSSIRIDVAASLGSVPRRVRTVLRGLRCVSNSLEGRALGCNAGRHMLMAPSSFRHGGFAQSIGLSREAQFLLRQLTRLQLACGLLLRSVDALPYVPSRMWALMGSPQTSCSELMSQHRLQ